MLRSVLFCVFLVAFSPVLAFAQHGLLYTISSGDSVLYLAGGFPLGKPEAYPLPGNLDEAFAASEGLAVKMIPEDTPEARAMIQSLAQYPEGDGLSQHVSEPNLFNLITMGFEPVSTERMRPWVLASILYRTAADSLEYSSELGMESHYLALAREQGKTVRSLDNQESIYTMLLDAYEEAPDELLEICFKDLAEAGTHLPAVMAAIMSGDEDLAAEVLFGEERSPAEERFHDRMFFSYNEFLADGLEELLATDQTWFVVLHAGHVLTDRGLPTLLEQRGYSVERY
ncbi:MAG: TraB/GumN family protein [Desulfovibrio sp.]|nr:MAG: TraB/GumN family protein [Desulfovibrio sp.]